MRAFSRALGAYRLRARFMQRLSRTTIRRPFPSLRHVHDFSCALCEQAFVRSSNFNRKQPKTTNHVAAQLRTIQKKCFGTNPSSFAYAYLGSARLRARTLCNCPFPFFCASGRPRPHFDFHARKLFYECILMLRALVRRYAEAT